VIFSPIFSSIDRAKLKNPSQIRAWLLELMQAYPLEISTPLALAIYAGGVRPDGNNYETLGQATLLDYFISQVTRDLYQLAEVSEAEYERFLDLLDLKSSRALLQLGQIAAKYDLYPSDYTPGNLSRISDADDRRDFEKHFLEEAFLNSAFTILAGVFYYVHGKLYPLKT
jgi:hypothetical protein